MSSGAFSRAFGANVISFDIQVPAITQNTSSALKIPSLAPIQVPTGVPTFAPSTASSYSEEVSFSVIQVIWITATSFPRDTHPRTFPVFQPLTSAIYSRPRLL